MNNQTVFCCQGWPIDGKKVHEVNRYRVGNDGQWVTLGKVTGDDFTTIVGARQARTPSHSCCTECSSAMRKEMEK